MTFDIRKFHHLHDGRNGTRNEREHTYKCSSSKVRHELKHFLESGFPEVCTSFGTFDHIFNIAPIS